MKTTYFENSEIFSFILIEGKLGGTILSDVYLYYTQVSLSRVSINLGIVTNLSFHQMLRHVEMEGNGNINSRIDG